MGVYWGEGQLFRRAAVLALGFAILLAGMSLQATAAPAGSHHGQAAAKKNGCAKKRTKKARKRCRAKRKQKGTNPTQTSPPATSPATAVTPPAAMSIGSFPPETPAYTGRTVPNTKVVTNHSSGTLSGISLSFPLPAGVAAALLPPGCQAAADGVVCAFGSLGPGASRSLTLPVRFAFPGNFALGASATDDQGQSATATPLPVSVSDLLVGALTGPTTPMPAPSHQYQIQVNNTNADDVDANGVVLSGVLPAGVTLANPGACHTSGQALTCDPLDLAPGGGSIYTLDLAFGTIDPFVLAFQVFSAEGDHTSIPPLTVTPEP